MIDLATESRPEVLRQVARLQQQEIEKLDRRLSELAAALAKAQGEDATQALQLELLRLREQLAAREQQLFGRSSEQRRTPASPPDDATSPAPIRRGHGPRSQPALPLVEVVHTLDEPDQACPACGGELAEMTGQFEDSDEIDVVERSYRLVRHRRQKYPCRCGGCVDTALGPPKLVPGRPLLGGLCRGRRRREVRRPFAFGPPGAADGAGRALDRHPDALGPAACGPAPSAPELRGAHDFVLAAPVVGADETTWPLLEKGGGKRWTAGSIACPEAVFYRIDPSRGPRAAGEILRGYQGVVVADGYAAYAALASTTATSPAPPRSGSAAPGA